MTSLGVKWLLKVPAPSKGPGVPRGLHAQGAAVPKPISGRPRPDPGGRSIPTWSPASSLPRSNSACAQRIAPRRRGYPRALTGSYPGAAGGRGDGTRAATAHAQHGAPAPPAPASSVPARHAAWRCSFPTAVQNLGLRSSTKELQAAPARPVAQSYI